MTGNASTRPTPRPVPALASASGYRPPRHPAPIDLNLAGNEGASPPAELFARVASRGVETLRRYPSAAELTARLAARVGVDARQLLVTAGADEAIDRVCRAYLSAERELLLPVPTFEMFEHYAALTGTAIVEVPWPSGPLPVDAMIARVTPRTAVITVVSPNNPTGAVATAADLQRLSAAAPDALLLVDLAYAEFADEDLTPAALRLPNALVCRSLSKAWGLAGLRVGYAVGSEPIVATLAGAGGPFSVAGPSLALACEALEVEADYLPAYLAAVRREREALVDAARALGVEADPSQGNFVLLRCADPAWVRDALASLGIGVRIWPDRRHLEDAVRLSCPGDADALARVTAALRAALAPRRIIAPSALHARLRPALERRAIALHDTTGDRSEPAWRLCTSTDEVRAAREVGAVALGFATDDATPPDELMAAGAARVLAAPAELEVLLR